jgi:hypothetical protein
MSSQNRKDLVILVADKNMEFAVMGILSRFQAINIRSLSFDIYVNPKRDPGCLNISHTILRPYINYYHYALVFFDREGSGKEELGAEALAQQVENLLARNGWPDRSAVIVIDPELENWIWSDSPQVDLALGWGNSKEDLRSWMTQQGFLQKGKIKPNRPKEAVTAALKIARKPRSSAIYQQIAQKVNLQRCSDPAFLKVKNILRTWFALEKSN